MQIKYKLKDKIPKRTIFSENSAQRKVCSGNGMHVKRS